MPSNISLEINGRDNASATLDQGPEQAASRFHLVIDKFVTNELRQALRAGA